MNNKKNNYYVTMFQKEEINEPELFQLANIIVS